MIRKCCSTAFAVILTLCLILQSLVIGVNALDAPQSAEYILETIGEGELGLDCRSALLMEASTGVVLYEQNADEMLPPASVTKVMTLLLVMEAIEAGGVKLDDIVTTSANAASMGGSQIFLEEGEQMNVEDMLKSVVIASANDAALALAEHICGSETAFVARMNERARELNMQGTVFENTNGLDDTTQKHLTCARDIAIMSRELIKHDKILEYSSIWMDSVRDGSFGLTNTNRLVRYYPGCTGLKTGSTAKAGFCISATAQRNGMSLICVIMGAPSRDVRNAAAVSLLDWGFAEYGVFRAEGGCGEPLSVMGGERDECATEYAQFSCVLPSSEIARVTQTLEQNEVVKAPIKKGDEVGRATYKCGDTIVGSVPIVAAEDIERITFTQLLLRLLAIFVLE